MPMSEFPVDDATLVLLNAACEINPDSGHTELLTFLDFGTKEKRRVLVEDGDGLSIATAPIFEVEYEEGRAPWSPNDVIQALIAEIQRLRSQPITQEEED